MSAGMPKPTKLELHILEALWTQGVLAVREIQQFFRVRGRPAYTTVQTVAYRLEATKAAVAHEQEHQMEAQFKRRGAFRSLRFDVTPAGRDDYLATFAHARVEVTIAPLSPDGKTGGLLYREIP
jgi:Penicillinase repressor